MQIYIKNDKYISEEQAHGYRVYMYDSKLIDKLYAMGMGQEH